LIASYFYLKNLLNNNKNIHVLLVIIVLFGLFEAIYALLQLIGLVANIYNYSIGGTYGNPGDLANLLVITYSISLSLSFFESKKIRKLLFIVITTIQLLVIVLSFSRTAWIATFIVSAIIICHFLRSKILSVLPKQKIITLSGFLSIVLFFGIASYHLYNMKLASADGRLFIWKLSTGIISEKPVTGHGYGSFNTEIREKQISYFKSHPLENENEMIAGEPMFAFNDFLQITIEYGIVAIFFLVVLLISAFIFKSDNSYVFMARFAMIAIIICMFSSYPLENVSIGFIFIILLAICSAFTNNYSYQLYLNKVSLALILTFNLAFISFAAFHSLLDIKNGLKWKNAYSKIESNIDLCKTEYDQISELLRHNKSFLLNYGSVLFIAKDYDQCINHFEKSSYLYLGENPLLMLGESYEKTKNFKKAEENYLKSCNLVPHKFMSKYKLFKLYELNHQLGKQIEVAEEIQLMKIKVFSEQVKQIKTQMNEFLSKNKTN